MSHIKTKYLIDTLGLLETISSHETYPTKKTDLPAFLNGTAEETLFVSKSGCLKGLQKFSYETAFLK